MKNETINLINSALNIRQNISLASFTTFRIGGQAKFFVEVASIEELAEVVKFAKGNNLSLFVLGGGSNILVADEGVNGLVIKMGIGGVSHRDILEGTTLAAGAGEVWDNVVAKAVGLGAGGIENLSLIPGTVGGAVVQNIGAYGAEVKDVTTFVQAYDVSTGSIVRLSNKECGFGYRSSVFKKNKNLIVLEAEFMLSKNFVPNTSYSDLMTEFNGKNPNIAEVRNAVIKIRKNKLPYPDEISNAGSFFKNPIIKIADFKSLISKYPELKGKDIGDGLIKLSAAQLIEKAGWKGKKAGKVGVSEKHALVLVNYGGGTAQEIANLTEQIEKDIEAKFWLKLEAEVEKIPKIGHF